MKDTMPICKDCKHFQPREENNGICMRPTNSEFSIITGDLVVTHAQTWCSYERLNVTRFQRFLGCDMCGIEAIHFTSKQP